MKRKQYREEKIISILKEHEAGASVPDLARRHGVAENTIYRWKAKFGGMDVSDAKKLRVDFSISGQRLVNELERLAATRALPKTIVCDNGPELTSKAMFLWSQRRGVKLHFIQPGKPTQNAFVESFNGKFREYCLDLNWFTSLEDARLRIERWRAHYNHVRPHRSLGRKPPAVFAASVA